MNILSLLSAGFRFDLIETSVNRCRIFLSLSLLWLCGCSSLGGGLFGEPCSVGPACQPGYVGNDCTAGCCGDSGFGLFDWMKQRTPTQRPLRHFPRRKPFQSRRVIDNSSYISPVGRYPNRYRTDECCPATPSCVAPPACVTPTCVAPSCVAPVSCAAPERCVNEEVCVTAPACAVPARCIEVPDCTAPVTCAAPVYYSDGGNYQFPQCTSQSGNFETEYVYEENSHDSDLPAVWNQKENVKKQEKPPIELPAPEVEKKVKPTIKKKLQPKKVPAPPKKFPKEGGAAFAPPLVPPTR